MRVSSSERLDVQRDGIVGRRLTLVEADGRFNEARYARIWFARSLTEGVRAVARLGCEAKEGFEMARVVVRYCAY